MKEEIIKDLLWKELIGYVHEDHVNGFEKAIKRVAEKITEPYVNDTDVVEMPYTPEYELALKEIQTFPARDSSENWSAGKWAEFYKKDIERLRRIAASALYEVKI